MPSVFLRFADGAAGDSPLGLRNMEKKKSSVEGRVKDEIFYRVQAAAWHMYCSVNRTPDDDAG